MWSLHLFALTAATSMGLVACSCGPTQFGGKHEVLRTLSCKNETLERLWDVTVSLGGRRVGFGLVGNGGKKSVVLGDLGTTIKIEIFYSFYPANGDASKVVEKSLTYDGARLAALGDSVGEVEFVCHGDEKWSVRAYRRQPDNDGPVILEEEISAKKEVQPEKPVTR